MEFTVINSTPEESFERLTLQCPIGKIECHITKNKHKESTSILIYPDTVIKIETPESVNITEIIQILNKSYEEIIQTILEIQKGVKSTIDLARNYDSDFQNSTEGKVASKFSRHQYTSGEGILFLGESYSLSMQSDSTSEYIHANREEKIFELHSLEGVKSTHEATKSTVKTFLTLEATKVFTSTLDECWVHFLEITKQNGLKKEIHKPSIEHKFMKNCWGKFKTPTNQIELNTSLIHVNLNHIKHVIYHELCHIFYTEHGEEFENLLEKFVPDHQGKFILLEAFSAEIIMYDMCDYTGEQ